MANDFHKNLKRFMEERNVTQRELAQIIGVSDVRMNKIATEEVPLRPLEVLNMLLYFDCKQTDLFGNIFEGYFDD